MLLQDNNKCRKLTIIILLPKKPGSNINLIYNDNNVHSALLNIIMALERALGILLETTANYHKDNIDNNIQ